MKILFLYPNLYGMNTLPPAIGLFTAILKKESHTVALFDTTMYEGVFAKIDSDKQKADNLNARQYDDSILKQSIRASDAYSDFEKIIAEFNPELIVMSATEDMYPVGVNLLKSLGNKKPPVVCGGVFATFAPDLAHGYSDGTIDYILKGEGEDTLVELAKRLQNGSDLLDLKGLYAKIDGKIVNNGLPPPVDITKNPLPDYSLFEESRFYRPMQGMMRRMIPIQTIRGCPYTCGYCNSPSQMQNYKNESFKFFRKQTIYLVREEIKHVVDNYLADSIYFWADTFLAWNDSEFEAFCEMYSEFKLPFWIQTRPETVSEWKFKMLQEVGLLRVAFGVEHGNEVFRQRVLARKVSNEMIIKNLNIVTGLGIPISVNNIIGFPPETRELAFDTIELNRHFNSDGVNAYTFVPFHGTPLRAMSESLGLIETGKLATCIVEATMLDMQYFPKAEIEGIRRCFVLYVKMPKDRWAEIKKAESLTPEGDKIFRHLKDECLERYMGYGDYEKEDDIEKIEFS